ncbi:MAG: excinuclease ABC subunit UvrB [Parcubacteria group bacterium]|nr:excinuclease ABC subunit UvrB [Parcubacteria group bacterium]
MEQFKLHAPYVPAGDQPKAIRALENGIRRGLRHQTLLGVTGSGKTFTMANVIARIGKPTLVIAHNKTLAAQLAQEYRDFFPENAVHYFVSYYDYYQPEAYVPMTDTYIEKEAQINEEIDRLRHAATQSLLTRRDVIVVASVSCIYGLGSPEEYERVNLKIAIGERMSREELTRQMVRIFFERTTSDLRPGLFRAIGGAVEVMPTNERDYFRIETKSGAIARIQKINGITREIIGEHDAIFLFPAKHFVTSKEQLAVALKNIRSELREQLRKFEKEGKVLEAERIRRRTMNDLTMLREVGYVNGIENYSRHLSGRKPGEPPETLLSYFHRSAGSTGSPQAGSGQGDFLTVIDESHVTIPQIAGMWAGDKSRKKTLVEHGFRLPSAIDNRPLSFDEFNARIGQVVYTSATPAEYEREESKQTVEQIIRPTGLVDPALVVRPVTGSGAYRGQVPDFLDEAEKAIKKGGRVMVTTLSKKMAEDLAAFLKERGVKSEYLHSDIKTIDRVTILSDFRRGVFDCLVGVNLLREGLDLPEVTLIGILDADKEGFLRSETSLIQIIGRAARNVSGRVILYADTVTASMKRAIDETERRRALQIAYNKKHGITPTTIVKNIHDITEQIESEHRKAVKTLLSVDAGLYKKNPTKLMKEKQRQMSEAIKVLDFETAAILRDEIKELKESFDTVS